MSRSVTEACSPGERNGVQAGTERFWASSSLSRARASSTRSSPLRAHLFNSSVLFMEASFSGGCSISHPAGGVNEGPLLRS